MPKYRRMTWTDRLIIEKLYNKKTPYRTISAVTGFSVGYRTPYEVFYGQENFFENLFGWA